MALPRNWSEMSFCASMKGPSTSTSISDKNSSVTYVRQCDGAFSSVSRTHPV